MNLISNFSKKLKAILKNIFFERFEFQYKKLPNQIVKKNSKKQIPNIVYQTWKNDYLPKTMSKKVQEFRNLNYDYSFILYSNSDMDKYMFNSWGDRNIYKIYKNSVFHVSKADIWRYCILYDKGGYYFDIKSGCKTPLSELNVSGGASISYEKHSAYILPSIDILSENKDIDLNIICNWAFGFKKKHPFLKIQIQNIEKYAKFFKGKIFSNPKANILAFTGPGMLTKSYREYLKIYKKKIESNGIDFNGRGIYEFEGSQYRYKQSLNYADVKDSKILK